MIDLERNNILGICHPIRMYSDNLTSRLSDAMVRVGEDRAGEAEEYIRNEEYQNAIDTISKMISRLEELESSVEDDNDRMYQEVYVEVTQKGYHGRVVRAAEEHGEDPCVLGALKAVKTDLENFY